MVEKTGTFEPTHTTPARLDYIMRAVTPTHSPIRFDIRFFLTDGAKVGDSLIETKKLEDIGWYSLVKVLDRLKIMGVTQFVLEEAWHSWRNSSPKQAERTTPFLTQRRGIRVTRRE
jgi:hypothetical protein